MDVTDDRLLGGRVRLRQPKQGYRSGIEPVLLAAAVPAVAGALALDVGCGAGAVAMCLLARPGAPRVIGVEIDPGVAALAAANGRDNSRDGRFSVVVADVLAGGAALAPGAFDHVFSNPPFFTAGRGTMPADPRRARATVAGAGDLGLWLRCCCQALAPRGRLTVILPAERLADALACLAGGLGGLVVFPLWPKAGQPARRVILAGSRGSAAPLVLAPGLVLHNDDGSFTAAADAILRDGAALHLP